MEHGVNWREIAMARISSGIKGKYAMPTKLSYKRQAEKFESDGRTVMAYVALKAARLVEQL